ncbi:nonsense-mediated mRNA decay factor SMG5-like [Liolophura sinensis]|uniref:nonsense-mediated mRNA decay factor SMG5-like n=1 Tax=Liolophura sinensis TaxID=3198878 RepID=UPI003158C31C
MIKTSPRFADGKPDVDKAKRIYRLAVETVRRLDDISRQKKAYRDVFRQDAVGLRTRLKEYCERLMFYDPALYGRKAEEVLWRKVFYDIIQLVKHNRRHIRANSSVENAFRTHLAAASGYYYHLLFRLQQEFALHFDGILDFYLLPPSKPGSRFQTHRRKEGDKAIKEWATKACHRCLVYLGDIARYQQTYDEGLSCVTAERYYYQALALFPDLGMPHNQLGTMAGSRHYSCDAAYHYIRCLVSELSFEGAGGNLDRLFEKISKRLHEFTVTTPRDLPPQQQRQRDVRRFLVRFMYLLSIFYKDSDSCEGYEVQEQCQRTLQDFDLCMFYEISGDLEDGTDHKPTYLDDDLVFRIFVMCMATIYYQQKNGSRQVAASIAFLLALVSHILNHVISRLQRALQEVENPVHLPSVDAEEFQLGSSSSRSWKEAGEEESSQIGGQDHGPGSKHNQKKRKAGRLRSLRRRRHRNSESSDDSCSSSLDDSDLSEGGEGSDDGQSLSEDSDDFIDCFAPDSDSDFEENLNKLDNIPKSVNGISHPRGSGNPLANRADGTQSSSTDNLYNNNTDSCSSLEAASDGSLGTDDQMKRSNVWNKESDQNLIVLSSELFTASSSSAILGQGHRNMSTPLDSGSNPPVGDGITRVCNTHRRTDSVELEQKLASFVIETDTETVMPTDAELSPCQSDSDADTEIDEDSTDKATAQQQHLANLLEVIQNEKLLPVVKVACDWMKCHGHVITTCAQSSQSLWSRLAVLLNFLPTKDQLLQGNDFMHHCNSLYATVYTTRLVDYHTTHIKISNSIYIYNSCTDESDILRFASMPCAHVCQPEGSLRDKWRESLAAMLPLVEDINLQCFVPLQELHATIDFSLWSQAVVKDDMEALLRIACLRQFGHYLSSLTGVEFFFQPEEKEFLGPAQSHHSAEEKTKQDNLVREETRRNQLMRDMAQLRLQAEVSQLEGSLQSENTPSFPPYLIPDTKVLCDHLPVFKHLTQSARCIIIIPLSVIDTLDFIKKESAAAREVIRWLEVELRKGNRYIRAQKAKEKAGPPPKKTLKKENREVWCLHELLSCGQYLNQQTGQLVSSTMVTVLTTHELNSLENMVRLKPLLTMCKQQGIGIETMDAFEQKWKTFWEGKG